MRCCAVLSACAALAAAVTPPHVVLIIADDLGWNDVGFHGMSQIPTPNLDALAASGLPLHNYYVTPICTPSRAALMTGKYPIHTGMQHGVLYGQEPRGLPLSERVLPQLLRARGYRTHLVGKWHLGSYRKEYLPLSRGFESHVGFWTGKIDMYDHTNMEQGSWGTDFRRGFTTANDLFGKYATDIYTDEAVKIISAHNASEPLFLVVAHSAVHSGNPYTPIRAPDKLVDSFNYIEDSQRQKFAAVLSRLDESVGAVVAALLARGLLRDCVLVFTTDNGGAPAGFNDNAGSNYPLRGTKNTLWEGGVRGAALVWSPRLPVRAQLVRSLMHVTDWLPTLYAAAGGEPSELGDIDGVSQWATLLQGGAGAEPRGGAVLNIDDIWGSAGIRVGDWKLLKGTNYGGAWDSWYGPAGRSRPYDADVTYGSPAARAASQLGLMPAREHFLRLREEATVNCSDSLPQIECNPLQAACLFNVKEDPCERRNLANLEPETLSRLLSALAAANATAVPPGNRPLDPRGDPQYWGRLYTNFGDYEFDRSAVFL